MEGNEKMKDKVYLDLALEGIKARPDLFLYLGVERIVATGSSLDFCGSLFNDGAFSAEFAEYYQDAAENGDVPVRMALGLPKNAPAPPYEEYRRKLEPAPGSWPARVVQACDRAYGKRLNLFRFPPLPAEQSKVSLARPTFLCVWLAAGALLSLLPSYRRTLGAWAIISVGYVFGVFLVSMVFTRYFAPVWPVLLPLLAIPVDLICGLVANRWATPVADENKTSPSPS